MISYHHVVNDTFGTYPSSPRIERSVTPVWLESEIDGQRLRFHLAGINNQNFLMRDEETGTYWQQISGAASAARWRAAADALPCVELIFALWKTEDPQARAGRPSAVRLRVLLLKDWDVHMRKRQPTVLNYVQSKVSRRAISCWESRAFSASRSFSLSRRF